MKKIGICGGADVNLTLNASLSYIGVDHGIESLLEQGITPIIGVGDFDSIKDKELLKRIDIEILPTRKDITDTHYAIDWAIEKGYQEIELYGVTGGRIDHYMAILCLLQKYSNTNITILDNQNKIMLLPAGKHQIMKSKYTYFSLFAIESTYITLTSCEYPLGNYYLTKEDPLCVSNQIVDSYVNIESTKDVIFIQSKDK
ncbi:MAG: thiamine diphosphokinase [Coprobacillaceae bacterium]